MENNDIYKKCSECSKEAKYLRATQFSGDHYFCEDHAILEERYGENDSYQAWYEIIKSFKPNKFTSPIIFKRAINRDHMAVEFRGKGFCDLEQLKEAVEEAETIYCSRIRRLYELLQQYSESEEHVSPEASKFEFNTEKFQDAINLGIVSRNEMLDMKYLEKEGIITLADHVRILDFMPIQDIIFTFKPIK